jgi:hypothetical protein
MSLLLFLHSAWMVLLLDEEESMSSAATKGKEGGISNMAS